MGRAMTPVRANNLLPLAHSATLLSMFAGNAAVAVWMPNLCWLTIPLAALAMCCALSAVHECAHRTYFTGRLTNEVTGRLWALVILMNFSAYKRDHMLHHRHQGAERDTEPQIVMSTQLDLVRAVFFNPHILPSWLASLRAALHLEPAPKNVRRDGLLLLAAQVAVAVALVVDWQMAMLVFFLPFALSTVLDNLVSLPEHARLARGVAAPVTRSMRAPRPADFLLYFVGRHIEHHERPEICVARTRVAEGRNPAEGYASYYARTWRTLSRATPARA
jgi:fatty acid desaturase